MVPWFAGCSRPSQVDTEEAGQASTQERREYTPPDIPLARRKQVFMETRKLEAEYEKKRQQIREQFTQGKLSERARDSTLQEYREKYEEDLKAILGRYGLRMKDYPNILAEARDKGW